MYRPLPDLATYRTVPIKREESTFAHAEINEWEKLFTESGFSDVKKYQFCSSGSWKGTLVIEGTKINI